MAKVYLFGDLENKDLLQLEQTLRARSINVERTEDPGKVSGICLVCFSVGFESDDFSYTLLASKKRGEQVHLFSVLFLGGVMPGILPGTQPADFTQGWDRMDHLVRSIVKVSSR